MISSAPRRAAALILPKRPGFDNLLAMGAGASNSTSFPMAHCARCGKLVLTAVAFDGDSRQRRCAHCDGLIDSAVEWIQANELEERGYFIGKPKPAGKGCGGGCACSTRRG
jgi:hypothetical protein